MSKGSFPDFRRQQMVRLAFLDGVKWACGPFNARFTAAGIHAVTRKATKVGLSDPLAILTAELNESKAQMTGYAQFQRSALERSHGPSPAIQSERHGQQPVFGRHHHGNAASEVARPEDQSSCAERGKQRPLTPAVTDDDEDEIVYEPVRHRR